MANGSGDSPRLFHEEEVRHLLAREVLRGARYQDFLCLCLIRPAYPGPPLPALQTAVARGIAAMLRSTDIVGLIGDDIAVLLVHTPAADGTLIAERIRERIEGITFTETAAGTDAAAGRVTLTIALSCFPTDATADGALLAHAQAQLHVAPRAGS